MADKKTRTLIMRGTIFLPMLDGETVNDAENRVLDALDDLGVKVSGWQESEIKEYEYDDGDE